MRAATAMRCNTRPEAGFRFVRKKKGPGRAFLASNTLPGLSLPVIL